MKSKPIVVDVKVNTKPIINQLSALRSLTLDMMLVLQEVGLKLTDTIEALEEKNEGGDEDD